MRSRSGITWALFVLILAGSFYLLFAEQRKPLTITLADPQQPAFGLVYIADTEGYFKKEGVNVVHRPSADFGISALDDVERGDSDLAATYDVPFLEAAERGGAEMSILTTLHYANENTFLAASSQSGIRNLGDLTGKKVATVRGSDLEYFLRSLLTDNNIDPHTVDIIYADASALVPLLAKNEIDAATIENLSPAELSNFASTTNFYSDTFTETSLIAGTSAYIEQNAEAVRRFLRALVDAQNFYLHDRPEAEAIVASKFPISSGASGSAIDRITLKLGLDNVLINTLVQKVKFAGDATASPSARVREAVKSQFLRSVLPESVTFF